jgi:multidrug efflux pump subunit AcrA (membrane-fusion protein)
MGLGLRTRRARVSALTGGVLVLALAVLGTVLATSGGTAKTKSAASTTSTVRRGTVAVTSSAAGTVQASATRGLSFSMTGTVTEVDVKAGDTVTAGQTLAKIDNTDAQSAVDTAQTQVSSAQDALNKATATATPTTSSGCQVTGAGYTSASPSPSLSTSASPSPTVRASATRSTGSSGGTGKSGSGTTGTNCGTSGGGTGTGSGSSRGGSGGSTDSLFSAQQQLNNANLALQQAQQKLAGTVITAPIAGKVLSVSGTVGSSESPGSTGFIVLSGVNDTEVTASFTETDVAHLAVGQATAITLPDRPGQTYTGKVSQVSPVGTTSGKLVKYPVQISFDQVPTDLLYGQTANVAVITQSVTDVLYVSSTAVTNIQSGSGTVTVRASGHDTQRTVQIGLRGDQYTEIKSGLSQGETVVVGG